MRSVSVQQTGTELTAYALDFVVVPGPEGAWAVALAGVVGCAGGGD